MIQSAAPGVGAPGDTPLQGQRPHLTFSPKEPATPPPPQAISGLGVPVPKDTTGGGPDWRDHLHRLDGLGLLLLPIGAGQDRKGPVDPQTGYGLKGWQRHPGFSPAAIAAMPPEHVIGAGIHTGPSNIDALDIDGAAAVAWVADFGVDPRDPALFRITRTTDPDRFKIPFRLTPEQRARLPQSKELLRVGEADAQGRRHAVELYGQTGAQVVALGQHAKSGGWYAWEGDPSMIGPPSEAWLQVLIALQAEAARLRTLGDTSRPPRARGCKVSGKWQGSSQQHPCPVCGRNHSAACTRTTSADGRQLVSCFNGGTFFPPQGLKPGEVVPGRDGGRWAFLQTYVADCLGEKSLFIDDRPRAAMEPAQLAPRTEPQLAQEQAAAEPAAAPQQQASQPAVLTLAQVEEQLRQAVEEGHSRTQLAALVAELARRAELQTATIRDLLKAIEQEEANGAAIKAETLSILAAADRQELGQALTLAALFPPSVAEALRVRCLALPADNVAAAVTYLVGLSGVVKIGTRVIANDAYDYGVPCNLYAALVADSGAKKSPTSLVLVQAPSRQLRLELAQQHDRALAAWKEENRGAKPADRTEPPRAAYIQVSDATAEALASQLQEQEARGLGMLLHRDELAGLFGNLNAYRSGRGADEQLLLEAYDGSGFHSLRVAATGGGRFYERCHLSIWGTIQPAVLSGLVKGGDPSGLWARFLFVPLPRLVVPLPDFETVAEQRAAAEAAATLAATCQAIYRRPAAELRLSPAAWQAFKRFEAMQQAEALRAAIPAQSALYGKAPGKVLRLAGLLHLVQLVAADGTKEEQISAATLDLAVQLVNHLNAWALSFHADVNSGGTSDLMRLVHKVATEAGAAIRWKDVRSRLSKGQRQEVDSAAVAAAMQALADLGVGAVEVGARGGASYRATNRLP